MCVFVLLCDVVWEFCLGTGNKTLAGHGLVWRACTYRHLRVCVHCAFVSSYDVSPTLSSLSLLCMPTISDVSILSHSSQCLSPSPTYLSNVTFLPFFILCMQDMCVPVCLGLFPFYGQT